MAKKFKCPYCNESLERPKLIEHINKKHEEMIPDGFSASRVVYNKVNKTDGGKCRVCGAKTDWNENAGRYKVLCNKPACKQHMRDEYKKNMLRVRGTYNILNDPEQQKIMLANRSISGEYTFSDGGKVGYTGTYEKKCLEFMDVVMNIPSEDIMSPGPTMEYEYNGEKHIYIPDFYYVPYNLIIEVKDGGSNPNTKDSVGMRASREKTIEKERIVTDRGEYNYIRLTNNDFSQLLEIFMEVKDKLLNGDPSKTVRINETVMSVLESSNGITYSKSFSDVTEIVNSLSAKEKKYIIHRGNIYRDTSNIYYREVLKVDNIPVSFIDVYVFPDDPKTGIIVVAAKNDEKYRHKGYTKMLVNRFMKSNKKSKLNRLVWRIDAGNDKSENFVKSINGFKLHSSSDDQLRYDYINESTQRSSLSKNYKPKGSLSLSKFKMITTDKYKEYGTGYAWVDDDNKQVAQIFINEGKKKASDKGVISELNIDNKYRGYGLSEQIMNVAINELGGNSLWVYKDNEIAIKLYKKMGFKIAHESDDQYFMSLSGKIDESYITETISLPIYSKLYHGSSGYYPLLKCNGIDFGNSFQKPGWSLFTWTEYNYALEWAIFDRLRILSKKYDFILNGALKSRTAVIPTESYNKLSVILNNIPIDEKMCYVYTIGYDKKYEYGLGHSSNTQKCITIRYNDLIKPEKIDKFAITIDLIDKYCIVSDRIPSSREYGVNSRLTSFLMVNDYMYNNQIRKILNNAVRTGELNEGDDIETYIKSKGVNFVRPTISQRISDELNESYIQEACKDVATARKFVADVGKLAKKYNANYFIVTDGASGTSNDDNPAVRHARQSQIEWEKEHGFDPNEDWSNNIDESYITEMDIQSKYLERGDSCYNLDKLDPNGFNVLYITGLSGSGKTTLANDLQYSMKVGRVELDNIALYYMKKTFIKGNQDRFYRTIYSDCKIAIEFLDNNPPEKYGYPEKFGQTLDVQRDFIEWFVRRVYGDGNIYIINGAAILNVFDYNYFYDKPIILKDPNYIKSVYRRSIRELDADDDLLKRLRYAYHAFKKGLSKDYRNASKEYNNFKRDMNSNVNEAAIDNVENLNEAINHAKGLTKKDIIDIMKKSKLPKDQYCIGCGGSLVLHGIINTTKDIDASCSRKLFKELSKKYEVKIAPMGGNMISINEYLDLFEEDLPDNKNIDIIDGLPCNSIEECIRFYERRGRDKDKAKIEIIKKWMANSNRSKNEDDIENLNEAVIDDIKDMDAKQLLNWMSKNIKYHHCGKVRAVEQTLKSCRGDCYDQTLAEYTVLKNKYTCGRLYMIEYSDESIMNGGDAGSTHVLLYFIENNKYYWFENAWENERGIHGPYKSLQDLKDDVASKWDYSGKYNKLYITNCSNLKPGYTPADMFMANVKANDLEAALKKMNKTAYSKVIKENTYEHSIPNVYFSETISGEMVKVLYQALAYPLPGKIAVKLHTGEAGNTNFITPDFWAPIINHVKGTVVECNTAYEGQRNTTEKHKNLIRRHGWDKYFNFDLLDAETEEIIPVNGGNVLKHNIIGGNMENYDSLLVLSHFKGHAMVGYGGALKNISIGLASSNGKKQIHRVQQDQMVGFGIKVDQDEFLAAMADAAKSIVDYFDGNIVYINVMKNLSIDCDCSNHPEAPCMKDIGILASTDPVALDRACIDLVLASNDPGRDRMLNRIRSRDGEKILDYAQDIGVGIKTYNLINWDTRSAPEMRIKESVETIQYNKKERFHKNKTFDASDLVYTEADEFVLDDDFIDYDSSEE